MRINHNISALNTYKTLSQNSTQSAKSLEKLSSGLRINKAGDDAAGLAISEKMRGQIRGLEQSSRNIQDAISMVQTAEGGLNEIHSLVQRGRELAVQASNDTLTVEDRQSLQDEVTQIKEEINSIANNTQFNTMSLLNVESTDPNDLGIINGLKASWLRQSEQLIYDEYGLQADGASLKIILDRSDRPYLAAVSYYLDGSGKAVNQELHIDAGDFLPATLPNGGTAPMFDDRVIVHEMVHAVMGRTMNFGSMTAWFKEGTAEYIHGADERVNNLIAGYGITVTDMANSLDNIDTTYSGIADSIVANTKYAGAYLAVKYMDANVAGGIKGILNYLSTNAGSTLSDALASEGTYTNQDDFLADFKANVTAFAATLDFTDADTGAIGGGTATDVVPDTNTPSDDPLNGFVEIWPSLVSNSGMNMQIGANTGQKMSILLVNAKSDALGISNADLTTGAEEAISSFDSAIQTVSSYRSRLGAFQNRLEHANLVNQITGENLTAAESRIRDVDMAKEIMESTKNGILAQAAQAMLSQANQQPQGVLQLLR